MNNSIDAYIQASFDSESEANLLFTDEISSEADCNIAAFFNILNSWHQERLVKETKNAKK